LLVARSQNGLLDSLRWYRILDNEGRVIARLGASSVVEIAHNLLEPRFLISSRKYGSVAVPLNDGHESGEALLCALKFENQGKGIHLEVVPASEEVIRASIQKFRRSNKPFQKGLSIALGILATLIMGLLGITMIVASIFRATMGISIGSAIVLLGGLIGGVLSMTLSLYGLTNLFNYWRMPARFQN